MVVLFSASVLVFFLRRFSGIFPTDTRGKCLIKAGGAEAPSQAAPKAK